MVSKTGKILCLLLLCFIFSCGGKPSVDDAQKALNNVFGKAGSNMGKVEDVEKINGWFENDDKSRYVMEVKYKIKLNDETKKELQSASGLSAILIQPLIQICSKDGKLSDTCEAKAKIVFRKTEQGWMPVKEDSRYIEQ